MKKGNINITPGDGDEPQPVEIIEQAIVKISEAMAAINKTRLTRRAVVVLIHDNSGIGKRDIEVVLNNLDQMETIWLKKKAT